MQGIRIFLLLAALIFIVTSLGRRTITAADARTAESRQPPAARVGDPDVSDSGHQSPASRVIQRKLTANDTIVLAVFSDNSGDSTLSDALGQVLRAALEESPFLNVVPPATVAGAPIDMAQPPHAPLTFELARSVCRHTRATAFASGSIVRHGAEFAVGLQAMDCESGQTFLRYTIKGPQRLSRLPVTVEGRGPGDSDTEGSSGRIREAELGRPDCSSSPSLRLCCAPSDHRSAA